MRPDTTAILNAYVNMLLDDATVVAGKTLTQVVSGRIYNHIPQDTKFPLIRLRLSDLKEWDTKDSDGYDFTLHVDAWTNYRGDHEASDIGMRITNIINLQPPVITGFQNLYCREIFKDFVREADGLTHHCVLQFQGIATS